MIRLYYLDQDICYMSHDGACLIGCDCRASFSREILVTAAVGKKQVELQILR